MYARCSDKDRITLSNLMSQIPRSSIVANQSPYKEDMDSVARGLSIANTVPCIAWNTILSMQSKYKKELSFLYAYYPNTHIRIVPDVLISNALIVSNLHKLMFILPRCMLLREMEGWKVNA